MRGLIILVVAAAILAASYAVTFGVPAPAAALIGLDVESETPAAGGGGGPAGPGGPRGGARSTTVATTALHLEPYESIFRTVGTASALHSVDVVTEAAGTVIETNVTANREVRAGDVLVRLDAREEALHVDVAQAELEQAKDIVTRNERLRERGNSTVTDVTLSDARVGQRLAEAALGLAEVALADRTILAPIDGRLGVSDVEVGDTLSANSFIVGIDQAATLEIEFELPERAIGVLAEGKEVLATTSAFTGRVIPGEIVSFDSRIDPVTRSVTVNARIDNSDGQLWPGMTFSVRLTEESDPLPMVPSTAITWSRAGASVWVDADGIAERVPVTILFRQGDFVWIDADIPTGTMVVAEGAQKLREGAQIATADGERPRPGRPASPEGGPTIGQNEQAATPPREPS